MASSDSRHFGRAVAIAFGTTVAAWIVAGSWTLLWVGFVPPGAFAWLSYAVDGTTPPAYSALYEPLVGLSVIAVVVLGASTGAAAYLRTVDGLGWRSGRLGRLVSVVLAVSAAWVGLVVPLSLIPGIL